MSIAPSTAPELGTASESIHHGLHPFFAHVHEDLIPIPLWQPLKNFFLAFAELHDLLGLYPNFRPKFAKCYVPAVINQFSSNLINSGDLTVFGKETRADGLHEITRMAVDAFIKEVKSGTFPDETFSYKD